MSKSGYDLTTARRNPYAKKLREEGYYIKIYVPPVKEREETLDRLELTDEELAMLKELVAKEEARRN
jgi:hypothetical protein